MSLENKILITGYPYTRPNYIKTFEGIKNVSFYLPKKWSIKGGSVVFRPVGENIEYGLTFFNHSGYPIIGGILKGFMPGFPLFILSNKSRYVFTALEPILLSCLYQTVFSKLFGRKHFIFTWENIPYDQKLNGILGSIKKLIIYLNIKLSDGVICGNQEALDIHSKYGKPTLLCPLSGVDSNLLNQRRIEHDGINVIYAGALDKRKGLDILIKAFREAFKLNHQLRLKIIGSGELEDELKKMAEGSDIIFEKWLSADDLAKELAQADIFVYPSRETKGWAEQFGYSMAEASLLGLPVISTKTGSISGVVLNKKTGILIEPENVNQLRDAIIDLASNTDLRREMGQAGQEYIKSNFSHEIVAEKIINFIKNNG